MHLNALRTLSITCLFFASTLCHGQALPNLKIRTITAGINLKNTSDTAALISAIEFLVKARHEYNAAGYSVQTIRISTQNFHRYAGDSYAAELPALVTLDKIAARNGVLLSIGQLLPPDHDKEGLAEWAVKLVENTSAILFSLPISSHEFGIHTKSIKASSEIIIALSQVDSGEANFRFTASANCPAGIPFFPAAYHDGVKSFALGLESVSILTESFTQDHGATAAASLKRRLEAALFPIQRIAERISSAHSWAYDGIDASPAPGAGASIGQAIETYSHQPFGSPATLRTCSLITDVLKTLAVKTCGYSGLMLPVIEDAVLARRAGEGRFTLQQLLLYSAVSGTGLDVVPLPGDTSEEVIENILSDVASLSLKYTAKALSARLFLIPGKHAGDFAEFKNKALVPSVVMKAN